MAAEGVQQWIWAIVNGLIGVPVALFGLCALRELLRSGIAVAMGFRVFEIRLAAGRPVARWQIAGVDLLVGKVPLGGATISSSGSARGYRFASAAIILLPPLLQLIWLLARPANPEALRSPVLTSPDILGLIETANLFLLVIQAFLPIRLPGGPRTDLRALVDLLFGFADASRHARATYYTRRAVHHLERAEVAKAEKAVNQGLIQLGREAMLTQVESLMHDADLTSVVDQGECADALRALLARNEALQEKRVVQNSFGRRAKRLGMMASPLTLSVLLVGGFQLESVVEHVEARWVRQSRTLAAAGDVEACTALAARWAGWAQRIDRWLPPGAAERSDRHLAFAHLEHCRGDLASAAGHQGEAMLAANAARFELTDRILTEPEAWLANELRTSQLFRHAATVETDRKAYRKALSAITTAEKRLDSLSRQIRAWPRPESRERAQETLHDERRALSEVREQVLANLSAR